MEINARSDYLLLCLVLFDSFELSAKGFYFSAEVCRHFKIRSIETFHFVLTFFFPEQLTKVECALSYLRDLLVVEPLNTLSLFPETAFHRALGNSVGAQCVLLSASPEAFVAAAVTPGVDAEAVFFVVLVLAFIDPTILPRVDATTVHVIIKPLSLILPSIQPRIHPQSLNLILVPLT